MIEAGIVVGILTVVLLVLKVVGVITWAWLWVLSPLWIFSTILILVIIIVFVMNMHILK